MGGCKRAWKGKEAQACVNGKKNTLLLLPAPANRCWHCDTSHQLCNLVEDPESSIHDSIHSLLHCSKCFFKVATITTHDPSLQQEKGCTNLHARRWGLANFQIFRGGDNVELCRTLECLNRPYKMHIWNKFKRNRPCMCKFEVNSSRVQIKEIKGKEEPRLYSNQAS